MWLSFADFDAHRDCSDTFSSYSDSGSDQKTVLRCIVIVFYYSDSADLLYFVLVCVRLL